MHSLTVHSVVHIDRFLARRFARILWDPAADQFMLDTGSCKRLTSFGGPAISADHRAHVTNFLAAYASSLGRGPPWPEAPAPQTPVKVSSQSSSHTSCAVGSVR